LRGARRVDLHLGKEAGGEGIYSAWRRKDVERQEEGFPWRKKWRVKNHRVDNKFAFVVRQTGGGRTHDSKARGTSLLANTS